MKKFLAAAAASAALLCATSASAAWTASQYGQLVSQFESGIAGQYSYISYPWQFMTLADCFQPGVTCPFSNPDGPYGHPAINGQYTTATQMGATDAFVLIMQTPPSMMYYGITPYIFTRYYSSIPGDPGTSGTREVLESLDDTIDMSDILTAGSGTAGKNSFSQLTAVIMTADKDTYSQLKQVFTSLNFDSVNQLDMPYTAVPLDMGTTSEDDYYTMIMRLAYPDDATAMQNYIDNPPVTFLQVTPKSTRTINALPTPTYKVPGDGTVESSQLGSALNSLITQLTTQYGSGYTVAEQTIKETQTDNYICVDIGQTCDGDNSDAVYTHDVDSWIPSSMQDKMLIIGVNHFDTGKATYMSHAIIDMENTAGVEAVNQTWLTGTALKMAGITSPVDPRYATYSQLYAFTVAYDCTGEKVCLTIPQPTSTNPVGITYGLPVGESTRIYLDPMTLTRPSFDELIMHHVYLMKKKTNKIHNG